MPFFYQPEVSEGWHFLDPEESRHCVKVLRHHVGDHIEVLDGQGNLFHARITTASPKKCEFEVTDQSFQEKLPFHIHIAIAPTKNMDRMEWFVEKAVEIGIQEISFVLCSNSERRVLKLDRLERKALSAMKQSHHFYLPKINALTAYEQLILGITQSNKFIACVDFDNPLKLSHAAPFQTNYCVLIGPEGDFTKAELDMAMEAGFKKVSLGSSRLRTETAGIVACHTLNMVNKG